jgi:hypothetical protein
MVPLLILLSMISLRLKLSKNLQNSVSNLYLPVDFGQFLDDGVCESAVRAFQIFTCLLKDLFEEGGTSNVVVLKLFHLSRIGLDLGVLKEHLETVLADHLEDHY